MFVGVLHPISYSPLWAFNMFTYVWPAGHYLFSWSFF